MLFLATPHEQSRKLAPEALAHGLRVIDLSGAWRLEDPANRAVYKFSDEGSSAAASTQSESVYGMPELHRDAIARARLVANPGCYATSIILALKPLVAAGWVDVHHGIVCDAKSGVSGAGKEPTAKTHFMYAADNLSAYGLFGHRHTGELLEQLDVAAGAITFTPHLLPIPRGILATIYVTLPREAHGGGNRNLPSRVLHGKPYGARARGRAVCRRSSTWCGQTSATSAFSLRRMADDASSSVVSTTC